LEKWVNPPPWRHHDAFASEAQFLQPLGIIGDRGRMPGDVMPLVILFIELR